MFQIDVAVNFADTIASLNGFSGQLPFATALALTKTAQAVQAAEVHEMTDVFASPTPWTLQSVAIKPATKTDLSATIFLKDAQASSRGTPADVYLTPEIRGGARDLKRFEFAFRSAGVLPSSYFMVPGQGARIDAYGNMAHSQITQLLSYFAAFGVTYQAGFTSNTTAAGRAKLAKGTASRNNAGFVYFVALPGGRLLPGIWQRLQFGGKGNRQGALKPIIMFVDSAHYEAIYDFTGVGELTVAKEFPNQLQLATQQALATAR